MDGRLYLKNYECQHKIWSSQIFFGEIFSVDKKMALLYTLAPLKNRLLSVSDMKLNSLLLEKKAPILERWFNLLLESYPADTRNFLKKEKDRFDNPVAYEFGKGIEGIYEALLYGMDRDRVTSFLDRIIGIRAVQDFPPSGAIAFVFLLKKVIREKLEREVRENGISEELIELESKIDGLALLCFDLYMKRREKLYEIRVNEVKNRVSGLLRGAGLISELQEEPDVKKKKH